jgi:hypothetical protein
MVSYGLPAFAISLAALAYVRISRLRRRGIPRLHAADFLAWESRKNYELKRTSSDALSDVIRTT